MNTHKPHFLPSNKRFSAEDVERSGAAQKFVRMPVRNVKDEAAKRSFAQRAILDLSHVRHAIRICAAPVCFSTQIQARLTSLFSRFSLHTLFAKVHGVPMISEARSAADQHSRLPFLPMLCALHIR